MDRPDGRGPGGRPFRERFTHAGGVSIGASGDLYTPGRHDRAHPSLRGGDPRAAWRCRSRRARVRWTWSSHARAHAPVSAGAIAMTRQRDRGSGRCAAILVERRAVGRPRRRSPRAKSRRGIREADEKLPVITGRSAWRMRRSVA